MSRLRKTILWMCTALCAVCLIGSISLVWAKYVDELSGSGTVGKDEGFDLPYEVSDPVTVNTQEDLFNAIQYGYSHIKLGDDMKNPFIVTENVTNLNRSLILDLNGKEIQRNNRDAMLIISSGVSLTLVDSSEGNTGGLYNPVGSVLEVNGGTLLVTQGKFESGPRPEEYYSQTGGTGQSISVEVSSRSGGVTVTETKSMPIFEPTVTRDGKGDLEYVDGNIYFDIDYMSGGNMLIPADTYCYFVTSDGFTSGETIAFDKTAADFSYSYYVYPETHANAYQFMSVTQPSGTINEDYVRATVYGYYNDIKMAESSEYAAVTMQAGSLEIEVDSVTGSTGYSESGSFWSYFGKSTSYCVNATGGKMTVDTTGIFSTVNPDDLPSNSLAKGSEGVCIRCAYASEGALTLLSGGYTSYLGDTIQVSGGNMYVNGGSFRKDASSASADSAAGENNAIIGISGVGTNLDVDPASGKIAFNLAGSGIYGIRSTGTGSTSLNVQNAEFIFEAQEGVTPWKNNRGVYATGGTVNAVNCLFDVGSDASYGIRAVKETGSDVRSAVNAYQCVFKMTGAQATGVYASAGEVNLYGDSENANDTYSLFYIDHVKDCYGVYVEGEDALDVNAVSAQFFMGQIYYGIEGTDSTFNGAAVYSDNRKAEIRLGDALFITAGRGVSGVYANQGTITATSAQHKTVIITGARYNSYKSGESVFPRGGNDYTVGVVDSNFAATQTDATDSHGILSNGGTITLDSAFVAVFSTSAAGIYANGGDVVVGGAMDMVVRNVGNGYDNNTLASTAVGTLNGNVTLNGAANILTDSLGFYVERGNLTANADLTIDSTRGTAVYVNGGNFTIGGGTTIDCKIDGNCRWRDGSGYSDAVLIQSGAFTVGGKLTISHQGLANVKTGGTDMVRSYAVRVLGTADVESKFEVSSSEQATVSNTVGGGVYVNGGNISVNQLSIDVEAYGLAMRGSAVTAGNVTIHNVLTLRSERTTGIYITGGSLTLDQASSADITSYIDSTYSFCSDTSTVSYDGVYVHGGSLIANGTFNVTHTGLQNDTQSGDGTTLYRTFEFKSYAVRVESDTNDTANVLLKAGRITNSRGGGAYVSGGNVTLGEAGGGNAVSIETTGSSLFDGYVTFGSAASNWAYRLTREGGPALKLTGGRLTIYGGNYSAAQGNGIVVLGGTADIYDGTFVGNDIYKDSDGSPVAGPAASYAFAVYGGTANVYDGSFNIGKSGSGAFVTGISGTYASANIYGGDFTVYGQGGFGVYEYANVLFDPKATQVGGTSIGGTINVTGEAAGLIVEVSNNNGVAVEIRGGTFASRRSSGGDGIWCGDGDARLTISGGTFRGSSRSGMRLEQNNYYSTNVQLSGGTFVMGISTNNNYTTNLLAQGYTYSYSGNTTTVVPR